MNLEVNPVGHDRAAGKLDHSSRSVTWNVAHYARGNGPGAEGVARRAEAGCHPRSDS
jgi:hypothetical protein